VFATFTFQNPGIYTVADVGSVTTTNTIQQIRNVPLFQFDVNCNCQVQIGFPQEILTSVTPRTDFAGNSLQVTVTDAPATQPVPEPGTLALFGIGLFGVCRIKGLRCSVA
jgi:hypothetical protein